MRELQRNDAVVDRLLDIADMRSGAGRYASAAEWCRIAATYAMTNATGRLRSARMERSLDRIAARALAPSSPSRAPDGARRVLHVLTEAAEVGGLTRLAERWIQHDEGSVSCVAVTRQRSVAPALAAASDRSGGWAIALGDADPIGRAARLRELAADVDIVVCHLQPDDAVAAIAFGEGYAGAPVAVFNHADHLFWIAPTHASLVADFRPIGAELSARGRGYAPEARAELPLLIPAGRSVDGRARTRTMLGIDDADVLIVTVARSIKFRDTAISPTFADLVSAALATDPRLVVCVVGATADDDPWPRLRTRYPGRVRAVGPVPDPHPYLAAGDIYLDPFPFSSLTSLLEASAAGLAVVSFHGHDGLRAALGIADFVGDAEDRPETLDAFVGRIGDLVADPEARRDAGERARATFEALVPETAWRTQLEGVYRRMRDAARIPIGVSAAPEPDHALTDYGSALLAVEQRVPLLWSVCAGIPHLDPRDRREWRARTVAARIARRVTRSERFSAVLLLGEGKSR